MRLATADDIPALEAICAHPDVVKWNRADGIVDSGVRKFVEHGSFSLLFAGGCFMCLKQCEGVYACHICLLPECRGGRALKVGGEILAFVFEKTDCHTLVAYVPGFNKKSIWYALKNGFRRVGALTAEWPYEGQKYAIHVFVLFRSASCHR